MKFVEFKLANNKYILIDVSNILYFIVEDDIVYLHLVNGLSYVLDESHESLSWFMKNIKFGVKLYGN